MKLFWNAGKLIVKKDPFGGWRSPASKLQSHYQESSYLYHDDTSKLATDGIDLRRS